MRCNEINVAAVMGEKWAMGEGGDSEEATAVTLARGEDGSLEKGGDCGKEQMKVD